ncbi:MAG: HlyD family efflux transporter periplasmic adaptor subunit [Planctomycetes bacterium]|nr:HlyD family efflux transporter periplasmic adaptor subunit [Planctomycetota bacterium]
MSRRASRSHEFRRTFTHHVAPILVWVAAVVCVVALFFYRSQRIEVVGLATAQTHSVSTVIPGRVTGLPVTLYQPVSKGQVVAVIDTLADNDAAKEQLEAQKVTLNAQIKHLNAQLVPTRESIETEAATLKNALANDYRNYALDVEKANLRILELRTQIATDQIALETLAANVITTQELIEADVVDASELKLAQLQHDTVVAQITENKNLKKEAELQRSSAQTRLNEFQQKQIEAPTVEPALNVIHMEIDVHHKQIDDITSQLASIQKRRNLTLTAPFDGHITHIQSTLTEVVDVNQPILTITEADPSMVVAYIDNYYAEDLQEDMSLQVVKLGTRIRMAECTIESIGSVVEQLPQQLWRDPTIPQWGRPFLVQVSNLDLVAGERVGLRRH